MTTKQEALDQIITLMQEHAIQLKDIKPRLLPSDKHENTSAIKKLFGLIGAIFILSGLGIYIGQHWELMNSAARIIITLGSGFCLLVLAVIASYDNRYKLVVGPLFIIAALFETIGLFVTIHELFPGGKDPRYAALIVFGIMLIQQIIIFWKIKRTALLFTALFFGFAFCVTLFNLMNIKLNQVSLIMGAALICVSYGLNKTTHQGITGFWYLIGSALCLYGLFDILHHTRLEIGFLGITAFIIYLSTLTRSKALLFNGTVAMIAYIGYFTAEHFVHSTGWPLALVIFGFIMVGISAIAIKIGRSIP